MNEFILLLENAAGAGWVLLVAIGAVAVGMLIFDRKPASRAAALDHAANERKAA